MQKMNTLFSAVVLALAGARAVELPNPVYGVNLGNWLVMEPWMMPQEWIAMGGQNCKSCLDCISTEFALAQTFPDDIDKRVEEHWESWFNEKDVQMLKDSGINTVRIPLGYWIVEDLVHRDTEFFPKGGLKQLRRGLQQLKDAGIAVILDHHALPGTSAVEQQFAGRCVKEADVQFYTAKNFHRALVWTAVMTALTHLDPNFSTVVAIQAINEPIMDGMKTLGYGNFLKNFVQTVRAVENTLGIRGPEFDAELDRVAKSDSSFLESLDSPAWAAYYNNDVSEALKASVWILTKLVFEFELSTLFDSNSKNKKPIYTATMDDHWQYNLAAHPVEAKFGAQLYDNHLYYAFGYVADKNEEAYMRSICNLNRVEEAAKVGNSPFIFGEWSLATEFGGSDEFMRKWADSQKMAYTKGAGWIFWNFKIEKSKLAKDTAKYWSYFEGLERGYLTKDPSQYNDPNVCDKYKTPPKKTDDQAAAKPSKDEGGKDKPSKVDGGKSKPLNNDGVKNDKSSANESASSQNNQPSPSPTEEKSKTSTDFAAAPSQTPKDRSKETPGNTVTIPN